MSTIEELSQANAAANALIGAQADENDKIILSLKEYQEWVQKYGQRVWDYMNLWNFLPDARKELRRLLEK